MDNKIEKMKDYSALASWAIWESKREDGKFIKEADLVEGIDFTKYEQQLQKSNTIFVAMNPGGTFDENKAKIATRKREEKKRPWRNFHTVGDSRDFLLAQAIKDTPESGLYMTDFFPINDSEGSEIKKFVNSKVNEKKVKELVLELDEEISLLLPNENEVRLLCIGRDSEKWANKFLKQADLPSKKIYKVYYLPHYSGSNGHVSNDQKSDKYYPKVVKEKLEQYRNE